MGPEKFITCHLVSHGTSHPLFLLLNQIHCKRWSPGSIASSGQFCLRPAPPLCLPGAATGWSLCYVLCSASVEHQEPHRATAELLGSPRSLALLNLQLVAAQVTGERACICWPSHPCTHTESSQGLPIPLSKMKRSQHLVILPVFSFEDKSQAHSPCSFLQLL